MRYRLNTVILHLHMEHIERRRRAAGGDDGFRHTVMFPTRHENYPF